MGLGQIKLENEMNITEEFLLGLSLHLNFKYVLGR